LLDRQVESGLLQFASRGRLIIAFVEECIERFDDERFVSFFHHHLSSP